MSSSLSSSLRDRARASGHKLVVNLEARRIGEPTWARVGDVLPQLSQVEALAVEQLVSCKTPLCQIQIIAYHSIYCSDNREIHRRLAFRP